MYYSVNMYKNKKGLIINIIAQTSAGFGTSTNRNITIEGLYSNEEIGEALIKAFDLCRKAPYWNESMVGSISKDFGYKDDISFCKANSCLMVTLDDEKGLYEITPTKRKGTTYLNNGNINFSVDCSLDTKKIGEIIERAFESCKK